MLRIVLIVAVVAVRIFAGYPDFLVSSPLLLRSIVYPFFHVNWWHLAVNCIAVWTVFAPKKKGNVRICLVSFLISALVYPLSLKPVLGLSNLLYAAIGLRTPPLSSRWWRSMPVVVFLTVTAAMLFIPGISGFTHIAAFVTGTVLSGIVRWIDKLERDEDRIR